MTIGQPSTICVQIGAIRISYRRMIAEDGVRANTTSGLCSCSLQSITSTTECGRGGFEPLGERIKFCHAAKVRYGRSLIGVFELNETGKQCPIF